MFSKWLYTLGIFAALLTPQIFADSFTPDSMRHAAFLMAEYDADKPDLMVFKDPRCPYCVKALKNSERLEKYNVYLFWSPILSDLSREMVGEFFRCSSPVSAEVIHSVSYKQPLSCNGDFKRDLFMLNDEANAIIRPRSVPQYWYAGQRVDLSQLNLSMSYEQRVAAAALRSTTKIPWQRYASFKLDSEEYAWANIALVLPPNVSLSNEDLRAIRTSQSFLNWFVFSHTDDMEELNLEFRYLTNLLSVASPRLVLEGKPLNNFELTELFEPEFIDTFERIKQSCCQHSSKVENNNESTSALAGASIMASMTSN